MAGKVSSSGGSISEPNVIPFIDILLVLLIIFMVTAPIPTVDIKVDLPPPVFVQQPPDPNKKPTHVSIREGNGVEIYVDGLMVEASQLGQRVYDRAVINNPLAENVYKEARVVVRADQDTAYANVIETMSTLQETGFLKVSIFSERANEG
jgi:biopolymer transport protein ExbD